MPIKNKISELKKRIKSKKPKKPVVVRGFSDDSPYEYAKGGAVKKVPSKQELIDLFTKDWQKSGYKKIEAKEFAEEEVAQSKFSINKDGFLVQIKPDGAGVLKKQIWQLGENKLILKDIYEKSTMSGVDNKWKKEDFAKGGGTDFVNEGAGMFANGGGISDFSVGDKVIIDSGYSKYDGKKAEIVRIMPDNKTLELQIKHKVGNDYIKFEKNEVKKYASGGATDFVNSGAGMFAKGGGIFGSREYKRGLAYKLDRAKHNKSEKWEKPLNQRSRYDEGGEMDEMKPKLSDDILMLLSQVKQIKHHADEILQMIDSDGHIDSWVIAKAERSATDISDIYHYLDGRRDIFCCGGTLEYGGAIVDYSYGLLADPRFDVQSSVFEDGGNILTEDTVARVDDPAFADVGQYAKGGEIDKEIIDASAKNIYEKQGMMGLRNIFLQTAQADENSGNKELADYRRMVVSEYQSKQPRYMAKGGKTGSNILKTYKRNEDRNLHSENVVLLAKNFGTKEDLAKAKEILKKHDDLGYLSSELDEERSALHKKLYPKLVEMNFDILNFED